MREYSRKYFIPNLGVGTLEKVLIEKGYEVVPNQTEGDHHVSAAVYESKDHVAKIIDLNFIEVFTQKSNGKELSTLLEQLDLSALTEKANL
jgi:hypothetical protein